MSAQANLTSSTASSSLEKLLQAFYEAWNDYTRAEKDERAAFSQARAARSALEHAQWRMGRALLPIFEHKMWRERGYRFLKDFVQTELPIGEQLARNYVRIAKLFSDDEIARRGYTKLLKLSQCRNTELRAEVAAAIDRGATNHEIEILMGRKPSSSGKGSATLLMPYGSEIRVPLSNKGKGRLVARGGVFEYRIVDGELVIRVVKKEGAA